MSHIQIKKRTSIKFALIVVTACILSSCSDKLTRDKAEKQIKEANHLPYDETEKVRLSKVVSTYLKSQDREAHNVPTKDNLLLRLEQEGLIDYSVERISSSVSEVWWKGGLGSSPRGSDRSFYIRDGWTQFWDISEKYNHNAQLTEKGKQYLTSDGKFKTAIITFGEVTGIVERKEFNVAKVNYTEKRKDITPFGRALGINEETFNKSATFTKFDDGWRISN